MTMLDYALAYASMGWPVFRLSKAKTPLRGTHGHLDATTDEALIRSWWDVPSPPNIGLACGEVVVIDFDGPESIQSPWGGALMAAAAANGGFPNTRMVATKRGLHFYFKPPSGIVIRPKNEPRKLSGQPGIDIKGQGGYVVAVPSTSNGFTYQWANQLPIAEMPVWMVEWVESLGGLAKASSSPLGPLPTHLQGRAGAGVTNRVRLAREASPDDLERIQAALAALPADGYDVWYQVGMALYSTTWERSDGTSLAFDLFDRWSETSDKYSPGATEDKWRSFAQTARGDITLGTLFHLAKEAGWEPPPIGRPEVVPQEMRAFSIQTPEPTLEHGLNGHANGAATAPQLFIQKTSSNPLIELNEQFAVIGDIGGKCRVLGWTPSKVDPHIKVPSFQDFKSFSERHGAKYIAVKTEKPNGDIIEENKQLGAYWLKWTGRKNYEGIDLVPNGPPVLEGNLLNLWSGFAIQPEPGSWHLMQQHITDVLADGDLASAEYILRFAAWCVQNPGKPAEAALVFQGDKGTGKGTFARALRDIFGQHGMQVFSSKHLIGQFNAHLRNCLLLFADEAFWAGDKQGESVLKGLITEPTLVIEQKGVDASQWSNRLKVIMAANADWVVPAGPMERRYAVFKVSPKQIGNVAYFDKLNAELEAGGLAAMLHALIGLDLKKWHPRHIIKTIGLREQKQRSMGAIAEWFEGVLQDGRVPGAGTAADKAPAQALLRIAREDSRKMQDVTPTAFGRFLSERGCQKVHEAHGNAWKFPALSELRAGWEKAYGGVWQWQEDVKEWRSR